MPRASIAGPVTAAGRHVYAACSTYAGYTNRTPRGALQLARCRIVLSVAPLNAQDGTGPAYRAIRSRHGGRGFQHARTPISEGKHFCGAYSRLQVRILTGHDLGSGPILEPPRPRDRSGSRWQPWRHPTVL